MGYRFLSPSIDIVDSPHDFWITLQKSLGTRLDISKNHHPQTYGQSERTIPTLEDLLLICVTNIGNASTFD